MDPVTSNGIDEWYVLVSQQPQVIPPKDEEKFGEYGTSSPFPTIQEHVIDIRIAWFRRTKILYLLQLESCLKQF